jgi:hypothetical protein
MEVDVVEAGFVLVYPWRSWRQLRAGDVMEVGPPYQPPMSDAYLTYRTDEQPTARAVGFSSIDEVDGLCSEGVKI